VLKSQLVTPHFSKHPLAEAHLDLSLIVGIASITTAIAQNARYETVTVNATNGVFAANTICIADYETGELTTILANNIGA